MLYKGRERRSGHYTGTVDMHLPELSQGDVSDPSESEDSDEEQGGMEVTQLERDVLRPAALDAMREREGRAHTSVNATETYPVYVVHIKRSTPGGLPMQLTSWPVS